MIRIACPGCGSKLKAKIRQLDPEKLLTDCLSCRMQFNQITPYAVHHPIEIIKASYDAYEKKCLRESDRSHKDGSILA